jgi:hypothetical protein
MPRREPGRKGFIETDYPKQGMTIADALRAIKDVDEIMVWVEFDENGDGFYVPVTKKNIRHALKTYEPESGATPVENTMMSEVRIGGAFGIFGKALVIG